MRHILLFLLAVPALMACDAFLPEDDATPTEDTREPSPRDQVDASDSHGQEPCPGVGPLGGCAGNQLLMCLSSTDTPQLIRYDCGEGERCQLDANGRASCVSSQACQNGQSRCSNASFESCVNGQWQAQACANGCIDSLLGAACRPTVQTRRYRDSLSYEARDLNRTLTGWGEMGRYEAYNALILSVADGVIIDSALSAPHFEIDVVAPQDADGDDFLMVALMLPAPQTGQVAFHVSTTGFSNAGELSVQQLAAQGFPNAQVWNWRINADQLSDEMGLHIPESAGSAAMHLFNQGAYFFALGQTLEPNALPLSLALWFDFERTWDCGACFLPAPLPYGYNQAQLFFPGDSYNARYWGKALTAHEFGHWWMSSFGSSPGEGGQHIFGIPTHPGLAWSEGFATWFASEVLASPYTYDQQNGLFFWIDLDSRTYSVGSPWQRPVASWGLTQMVDENEVSSMLRGLSRQSSPEALLAQLSSPRMTRAPFARGYVRRLWNGLNQDGLPLPYQDSFQSAPFFADFLDALICSHTLSAPQVDAVTEPYLHFPYPSNAPLCQSAGSPLEVSWRDAGELWEVTVRWHLRLDADLRLSWVGIAGKDAVIARGSEPGVKVMRVPKAKGSAKTVGLQVELKGKAWGVAGLSQPPEALQSEAKPELFQKMAPLRLGTSQRVLTQTIPLTPQSPSKDMPVKTRETWLPSLQR